MKATKFILNKEYKNYKISQSYKYIGDDYWDWEIWIDAMKEDLEKIDFVIYNLHQTFIDPVRIVKNKKTKFKLETSGWGTFTIYAIITFTDKTVIHLEHDLELEYPSEKSQVKH